MLVSVLLRLDPAAATDGRLVGRAEIVADGRHRLIHDVAELLTLVRESLEGGEPLPSGP